MAAQTVHRLALHPQRLSSLGALSRPVSLSSIISISSSWAVVESSIEEESPKYFFHVEYRRLGVRMNTMANAVERAAHIDDEVVQNIPLCVRSSKNQAGSEVDSTSIIAPT